MRAPSSISIFQMFLVAICVVVISVGFYEERMRTWTELMGNVVVRSSEGDQP